MKTTTWTSLLAVSLCVILPGCAVNEVITAEETELIVAETPPDEAMLLDIGVVEQVRVIGGKPETSERSSPLNHLVQG